MYPKSENENENENKPTTKPGLDCFWTPNWTVQDWKVHFQSKVIYQQTQYVPQVRGLALHTNIPTPGSRVCKLQKHHHQIIPQDSNLQKWKIIESSLSGV